ncbi:SDR family NAD(P)-dependent oxidoreductase [Glycomyces harbinensis]|uniref:NADP-dependent 3-hydroxy acid dehydrogenase YdfG n=1 Tax=Glycomyces harbinensis TaxID=58114 RepID=A0A1G6T4J2_9ACTN|nr:SDR family NAD(P)-dependent oxidoreductase [Glycomyces harbinensis]SDD23456.1 NADP-dependent 3-hydroxy acid dehydrogenase YdfG [Glycomyces harbinensis]
MTKKIALVTGANKGIGFEIAKRLGKEGLRVLVGARSIERGEEAAAKLRGEGFDVGFVRLDVTDPDSISAAVATVGDLDILVNNAGVALADGDWNTSELTAATARTVFETNVIGVIAVTNAFLPALRRAPAGRIVNVSSEVGSFGFITDPKQPFAGMQVGAYGASKSALNMLTVSYATELKDSTVKINAMTPGYTKTDLNKNEGWRDPALSAKVAADLALLDDDGPHGGFFQEGLEYHAETTVPW